MCNERNFKDEFSLNDCIRIQGPIHNFNLFVNNHLLLRNCINFSFITNKIFVTRCEEFIYVFGAKARKSYWQELAKFSVNSTKAFSQVQLDEMIYIIDYECQITSIPNKKQN